MPNVITKTVIEDGPVNLVVLVNITGDGSGDETAFSLIDRSSHGPGTKLSVQKVAGLLGGFSASLKFSAGNDLTFVHLPADDEFCHDWKCVGGVSSTHAGAGANGDVIMTTNGLDTGSGTFMLYARKA